MLAIFLSLALGAAAQEDLSPKAAPAPAKPSVSLDGCRRVPKGCVYAPKGARGPLVLYLRGHYHDRWGLKPEEYDDSLAEAIKTYGLLATADKAKAAMLITASAELVPDDKDIAQAARMAGVKADKIVVASHSGSWRALGATLDVVGGRLSRLIMLDNLYFEKEDGLAQKINALGKPGRCIGFYTEQDRYDRKMGTVAYEVCPMQDRSDWGHFDGVVACLGPYLEGKCCPAQNGKKEPDCLRPR